MKGIISGFQWLISTIKSIWGFVSGSISTIAMVFRILLQIVDIAFNMVLNLPDWLQAFAVICIALSVAYIVIGRETGKSD